MLFWTLSALLLIGFRIEAVDGEQHTRKGIFAVAEGKVLRGHVIRRYHVTSEIKCGAFCKANKKCKSYNYEKNGPGKDDLCELNDATRKTNPASYHDDAEFMHFYDVEQETTRSCLDYLRNGATENGIYTITDVSGDSYQAWCDLNSEPRSAWTLFLPFTLKNRHTAFACRRSLSVNLPTNQDTPNWQAYRLSLNRMKRLADQSTHWRATTGFNKYGVDYTDYMRGKLSSFDILSFHGHDSCKEVEYINIRGHNATAIQVAFWQIDGSYVLHIDSSLRYCTFNASTGSVPSENDFGFYCENDSTINPNFRGSENDDSTTEWWFGGYL